MRSFFTYYYQQSPPCSALVQKFGLLVLMGLLLQGCASNPKIPLATSNLDATLWAQKAAEHDVAVREVFDTARSRLLTNATNTNCFAFQSNADNSGGSDPKTNPTTCAVILDIDETVLDNSRFQGELIFQGKSFDEKLWNDWVLRAEAPPLPGAVEFCQAAHSNGVKVIFVTNRGGTKLSTAELESQRKATLKNLAGDGFPVDDLLMTGEPSDDKSLWPKDKSSRREHVASKYRVIELLGDDLGDFTKVEDDNDPKKSLTPQQRRDVAAQNHDRWGTTWFLIPDPMYGSWIRAVTAGTHGREAYATKIRELSGMNNTTPTTQESEVPP